VWHVPELVFRSANPSSMWPVAPLPPRKDNASIEATHAGVPAAVLVEVLVGGVVVTVVVAAEDDACVDELAALLPALFVLEELPQPAIPSAARAQISKARMCIT
jgi:hypothetical protein